MPMPTLAPSLKMFMATDHGLGTPPGSKTSGKPMPFACGLIPAMASCNNLSSPSSALMMVARVTTESAPRIRRILALIAVLICILIGLLSSLYANYMRQLSCVIAGCMFSLNFHRPFEVLEDGIYGPLAFGGRPYKCVIPFTAVWAIYEPDTEKGQVWEASIPEDIDWGDRVKIPAGNFSSKKAADKHSLRMVSGSGKSNPPKRGRSHLRVIK